MNKISSKVLATIGGLVSIVGMVLAIVYVLTGKIDTTGDESIFIGHPQNKGDAPEILALISFLVVIFGLCFMSGALMIEIKGLSKVEKKEAGKSFNLFSIGVLIGIIAAFILVIVAPKNPGSELGFNDPDKFKSQVWFYVVIVIAIVGAITTIVGYVKLCKDSKKPIISQTTESTKSENKSKDEF